MPLFQRPFGPLGSLFDLAAKKMEEGEPERRCIGLPVSQSANQLGGPFPVPVFHKHTRQQAHGIGLQGARRKPFSAKAKASANGTLATFKACRV